MTSTFTYKIQGVIVASNAKPELIPFMGKGCSLSNVLKLEQFLLSQPDADTSGGDVEHYSAEGLYARKLTLPAGSTCVGEMHLKSQINVLMKGTIAVTTEFGVEVISAPQIVVSPAGTKRAGHALTEVEWLTINHTNETDLAEIRKDLIADSLDDPRLEGVLCLGEQ